MLDFDLELIFQGDAVPGVATERRKGFEFANYYKLSDWLTINADLAYADARIRDIDPVGVRISRAVEGVTTRAQAIDNLGAGTVKLDIDTFHRAR